VKPRRAKTHSVYVIELGPVVLKSRKFREMNPDCDPAKACFYVGMTARTPAQRFAQHKAGYKSGKFVRRHGLWLRPRLYGRYNPMTRKVAEIMERSLAARLRKRGHGVWQN